MLSFLFVGCATTMNVELKDQTGRVMPDPHYVLHGIENPIQVLFFYTAYEEVSDVDGTVIGKPKFLDLLTHHDIFAEKTKRITLTIQVNNPNELEYSLYRLIKLQVGDARREVHFGDEINRSKLPQRQFVYSLPYSEDVRAADYLITLQVEGSGVMEIGTFRYNLIH
jgi:hypothetical protein